MISREGARHSDHAGVEVVKDNSLVSRVLTLTDSRCIAAKTVCMYVMATLLQQSATPRWFS